MHRSGFWKRVTLGTIAVALAGAVAASAASTPAAIVGQTPAVKIIVLARHGHYDLDPKADPKLGPGLSTLGIAQAHLLGARLAGEADFDAVRVSPLQRAQDTARVVMESLDAPAMTTLDDLAECMPPTHKPSDTVDSTPASLKACTEQLDRLFATRFKPANGHPQRELLVCHGNVIRYLTSKVLGLDPKSWLAMSFGHTSLSTIRIDADGSMRLLGAGDLGHLPPKLRTGALGDPERSLVVPTAVD
ncbi:MAG: histidine phosphatase family protein [Rhodanobacteraceae bacterium]|jgi:serine/threonine-protein phosphatase PGAM5|nr:histidine phosphatase family protein [Rhodanobacteraceae bacterium]MBL0041582.1 histidine phosphatase family protein [Xanthomonadales bacterium]MBP6078043.1 histidine phosphatase family protein [Xanthomonadales bacterium]MBP7623905.1 histidine phosphatase family protein [Xanthomonadales bacterium]